MITAKKKAIIVELWDQGLTGGQIAEKIGTTRNAVIGHVTRLRKAGHVFKRDNQQVVKDRSENKKKNKANNPVNFYNKDKIKKEIIITPKQMPIEEVPKLPTQPGGIGLMDLKRISCRFIVSGDDTVVRYCGENKERGAYCAGHYKICYYPAKGNIEKSLKL